MEGISNIGIFGVQTYFYSCVKAWKYVRHFLNTYVSVLVGVSMHSWKKMQIAPKKQFYLIVVWDGQTGGTSVHK